MQKYKVILYTQTLLHECCVCSICKKKIGKLDILEDSSKRKGMSELLIIKCRNCSNETRSFTSRRASSSTPFDINIRLTYASLPFGREGLAKFCGIMDLPAPVLNPSYTKV